MFHKHIFSHCSAVDNNGHWKKCLFCRKEKVFDPFNGKEVNIYKKYKFFGKIKLFISRNLGLHLKIV